MLPKNVSPDLRNKGLQVELFVHAKQSHQNSRDDPNAALARIFSPTERGCGQFRQAGSGVSANGDPTHRGGSPICGRHWIYRKISTRILG